MITRDLIIRKMARAMWDVKNKELWAEGKYNDIPVEFYEPMAEAGLKALIKLCKTELEKLYRS